MVKWVCILGVFIFLNNAYWILRSGKTSADMTDASACAASEVPSNAKISTPKITGTEINTRQLTVPTVEDQQQTPLEGGGSGEPPRAIQTNMALSEESREWIDDLIYEKEIFDLDSDENKLAVIEKLTPQGTDLVFIQQVMASEESEDVKMAALYKLRHQSQYGAIHTAIQALNSGSKPISLAALDVLKSTNDLSIIPQLKQLIETEDQSDIKQAIHNTVQALEQSASMGMDPAPTSP